MFAFHARQKRKAALMFIFLFHISFFVLVRKNRKNEQMLLNFKNWCISIQCKSCCLKSLKIDFFSEKKVFSKCNFFAIQVIFLQQPYSAGREHMEYRYISYLTLQIQKRKKHTILLFTSIRDQKKQKTTAIAAQPSELLSWLNIH